MAPTVAPGPPATLEEIDVERHTAREISTVVARHLSLPLDLSPAEVVVQGKELLLRQAPEDVLSPPARPGTGGVKLQLQEIADALIAKQQQQAAATAAAAAATKKPKPPALQALSPDVDDATDSEGATSPLPTPDRIDQALGEISEDLETVAATSAPPPASAPPTPDAGSGGKAARMKSMLDPNEAAGFPRGLRKTERLAATEPAGSPAKAAAEPAAEPATGGGRRQDAKNQTAVRALLLCQVCRSFGIMLRMQTETQIWLNAFAGDYAGQARVQGNLESISGILGFIVSPIIGGLSDAYGRRPMMIMSPCFSVMTNILIVSSPTVSSLVVRRLLMPFSSTPWHSGEAAALADMFKNDPAAYSVAKSRINIVNSVMMIVCPLIGAKLAAISLRLPWAVCGVSFAMMIVVSCKYLEETLPVSERVPFRFKGSNPLSFVKLFQRGTKMRMLALSQVWDGMCGRMATFRYEQLHQQQLLNWGLEERGRFSSYRGLLSVPASWISGWLLRTLGTKRSLFVGTVSSSFESLCNAVSTQGLHFYLTRPLSMTSDVKELSMAYTTAAVGSACGIQQGELQSSLSNLRAIVNIITPIIWGKIYGVGVERGFPSLFYYVSAAAGAVQLLILAALVSAPDPPKAQEDLP